MKEISKLIGAKGFWLGAAIGVGVALLATQVLGLGVAPKPHGTAVPTSPGTGTAPPGPPQG